MNDSRNFLQDMPWNDDLSEWEVQEQVLAFPTNSLDYQESGISMEELDSLGMHEETSFND